MPTPNFLGTALPLIQAPMAGVQGGALAVAVSNSGALGSLPAAMLTPETLRTELQKIQAGTQQPFNVNFFCHTPPQADATRDSAWLDLLQPFYLELGIDAGSSATGPARAPFNETMAGILAEFKPPVVSFHFGLPAPALLAKVKAWGATVLSSATTVEEALWLQANGADAIIAQGLEAGGHRGHFISNDLSLQMGTFALLPQIVRAVNLPVIAAGGIADAAGVRSAMALGASAVQVGTAFLLSDEATTSAVHRSALQSEAARHTALTNLFSGRPARSIVNRFMRALASGQGGFIHPAAPAFPGATTAVAPLRARAEACGSGDFSPLWSGQNASACRVAPAAEIVKALSAGLK